MLLFILGHAPWSQHNVYRQIHMLMMCSKKDVGAFEFTKKLEEKFNIYLPEAKAKVARAPHIERIFNLLKTDQIPLAVLSYNLIHDLIESNQEYRAFFVNQTKLIFPFSEMVLISNREFPSEKSKIIFDALIKVSQDTDDSSLKISYNDKFLINFDQNINYRNH